MPTYFCTYKIRIEFFVGKVGSNRLQAVFVDIFFVIIDQLIQKCIDLKVEFCQ